MKVTLQTLCCHRPGRILRPGIILLLVLLQSCSVLRPKIIEKVVTVTETKDSIIIRDRIVHDTVKVEIPVITERIITPADSSHLENDFAVSDAYVKDGLLHHSLSSKPQTLDVPVDIHVSDTTTVHKKDSSVENTGTKIEYVEKQLTRWQSFSMTFGRIAMIVFALALAAAGVKLYLKWKK